MGKSHFSSVAAQVATEIRLLRTADSQTALIDRDAEYQRVNGYIADVVKENMMLYSKLARLQSDFTGRELHELEQISEKVLSIGESLSHFAKAFYEGKAQMAESSVIWGEKGGSPMPNPEANKPPPADYDVPVEVEEEPPPPQSEQQEETAA